MALQATRLALKKILFATDFSRVSEAALPYAVAVARRFGSSIEAVHVFALSELQMCPEAAPIAVGGPLTQRAENDMADLLRSEIFEDVPHDGRVRSGIEVWSEIESLVKSEGFDLVVLGSHGREGLKQVVLGSVAETIFRAAPCPVLVVGPKAPRRGVLPVFRDLLFATDLSPASLKAVPFVEAFAEENQADVIVLHVCEEKVRDKHEEDLATDSLGKWMRELIPPMPGLEYAVRFGSPTDNVLKLAAERECDLIMLGAHHASNFASHLPGAVAHRIVSEAPCPVLTVHWKESAPDAY